MSGIRYKCRGPRKSKDSIERKGCGTDLTKAIEAVKQDGKDYTVKCPKCGNVVSVCRTPADQAG